MVDEEGGLEAAGAGVTSGMVDPVQQGEENLRREGGREGGRERRREGRREGGRK